MRTLLLILLCCLVAKAEPLIMERITALEAARQPYGAELQAYLKHPDPEVRGRTARALGRLQDPAGVKDLALLLQDEFPEVRQEAAFALGQIPGRESENLILAALKRDLGVPLRVRLIEAAVKAGDEVMLTRLDDWLERQEAEVVVAACIGAGQYVMRRQRWEPDLPALPDRIVLKMRGLLTSSHPEIVAAALYGLYRAEDKGSAPMAAKLLTSPEPEVVRAAARLLSICAQPEARVAMVQAVSSRDWIVRVELARGLALVKEVSALKSLLNDPHPSVRRTAAGSVGKLGVVGLSLAPVLAGLVEDKEADVAEAAVEALGLVGRASVLEELRSAARSPRWRVRRGAARVLSGDDLLALGEDPVTSVVEAVLERLERTPTSEELVLTTLGKGDVALTAAAAGVLARWKDPAHAQALLDVYAGLTDSETQQAVLEALGPLGNPVAVPLLESVAFGSDLNLARAARKSLAAFREVEPLTGLPGSGPTPVQAHLPAAAEEETALIVTERGPVRLRLLGHEAPGTVGNFVTLARKGYYDGLTFHRVVPDFVTQGGDPRGDGWGGPGYAIRCEINPVQYKRGTVGMALAGKDTGGSQFFITHSPQPHLDGRYTVWAQVEDGMDVVDLLQEGDKIIRVELP